MADSSDRPDASDIVICQLDERDGLDVYRLVRGDTVLGEFTGRGIGAVVLRAAAGHTRPGRSIWLRDELGVRRLNDPTP